MITRLNVENNERTATTSDESRAGNVVPLRPLGRTSRRDPTVEFSDVSQDNNSKEPRPPAA